MFENSFLAERTPVQSPPLATIDIEDGYPENEEFDPFGGEEGNDGMSGVAGDDEEKQPSLVEQRINEIEEKVDLIINLLKLKGQTHEESNS